MRDERAMGRRRALGILSIPVFSGSALAFWRVWSALDSGDSSSDDEDIPALTGLTLQNNGMRDVEMHVTVEKAGERVYDETHALAGIDIDEEELEDGAVSTSESGEIVIVDGDWLGEAAEYAVTAEVDGMETATYATQDYIDNQDYEPDDCPGFDLNIVAIPMRGSGGGLTAQPISNPDCTF